MCDGKQQEHGRPRGPQPCIPREITIVVTVESCTGVKQPQEQTAEEPQDSASYEAPRANP